MASFADSFVHQCDSDGSRPPDSTHAVDDGYSGYDLRLPSQRFDSFSNFPDSESGKDSVGDSSVFNASSHFSDDDAHPTPEIPSPPPIYVPGGRLSADLYVFSSFSQECNRNPSDGEFGALHGPVLPPPSEMQADEEGFALREWRRLNTIRLQEKEKREKESLNQIIDEADEFKLEFYWKRKVACESHKNSNREKEKLFVCNQEKFYAGADKNYWKAVAELIPNEVPAIAKSRGKKDREKEPSIAVMQGPKPGRPTDLQRMRQILVNLKHDAPPHLRPRAAGKDDKVGGDGPAAAPPVAFAMAAPPKPVAAFT